MIKENKVILKLDISLDGLMAGEQTPTELFCMWIMNGVFEYGEQAGGLNRKEQRVFWRVRQKVEDTNKVKDEQIEFEQDEFLFLDHCFEEGRFSPKANELINRITEKFDDAREKYLPELTKTKT